MKLTPLPSLLATLTAMSTVAIAAAQSPQTNRLAELRSAKAAVLQAEAETPPQKAKVYNLQDLYGIKQSQVGDSIGAVATLDQVLLARGIQPRGDAAEIQKYDEATAEDAVQAMVAAARDKRAVLINESHHNPMHRAFAQKLAKELHKIGFNYLACETFTSNINAQPTYITKMHGFYTEEPVFAQFINSAHADGWTLVPYEFEEHEPKTSREERIVQREIAQAKNLYERIYAKDPNAKALIYVGYGHLAKGKLSSASPTVMGTLLRERLGGNATLHIDQEKFYAHENRVSEHPLYRPLLAKFKPDAPFVVRQKDGKIPVLSGYEYYVDMQVIFPDYGLENGRPQWLSTLAGRKPQAIPAELLPQQGQRLILAYGKQHGPDAVPIDAVLVEAGKPAPALMLPEGEVRLRTED